MAESSINCRLDDAEQEESARNGADWVPLNDLAEVNPRSPSPADGETVSFVAMADVSETGVIDNFELTRASTGYTPFTIGDVLVAKITPCFENGKGAHVQDLPTLHGLGSTEFHVLRARPITSNRYLYHLTRTSHFRLRGEGMMSGSAGQRRVPTEFFGRYAVRMPSLEEQRRIAEILDTIDETIQATERVITKHERVRAGLAAVLLSHGAGDASELDTPLPQERGMAARRAVALGEIVQILDSRRVPVREEDRPSGSVPYYGANGQQGWIDRALFDEPLVLLAEDGGHFENFVDRPIAYRIDGPSWVNNHAHVLRAARGVDQSYLFWSLRNKDIRRWIAGGTRSKLTQAEMERIRLFIPPLKEQRRIAAILDAVNGVIQVTEAELDKLWRLRSGLAADLLSGQVRTVAA